MIAPERIPVDPISIRHMGAIEIQSVQIGVMAGWLSNFFDADATDEAKILHHKFVL